jgi:hypothetical protein
LNKHWILLVVLVALVAPASDLIHKTALGGLLRSVALGMFAVARGIHEFNRRYAMQLAAGKSAIAVSCGMGDQ